MRPLFGAAAVSKGQQVKEDRLEQQLGGPSDAARADRLRDSLVDSLRVSGAITTEAVASAFRVVPRHAFVPGGTSLEVAYDPNEAPPTKWNDDGVIISSVSAPFLQAQMIEQAGVRRGARVLEIGSGLYRVRSVVPG